MKSSHKYDDIEKKENFKRAIYSNFKLHKINPVII